MPKPQKDEDGDYLIGEDGNGGTIWIDEDDIARDGNGAEKTIEEDGTVHTVHAADPIEPGREIDEAEVLGLAAEEKVKRPDMHRG